MHIMSMSWSIAEVVSSGSWPILFKVLTLKVDSCIVLLHLSNFCFSLRSVADFSNTGARAPTSAGRAPFLLARREMRFEHVVWVWVMVIFRCLCFILIHRHRFKRWVAEVPWLNYLILVRWPVGLVCPVSGKARRWLFVGFVRLYVHHTASHGLRGISCGKK